MPARPDYCSKDGAHRLARNIERFWREQGSSMIEAWVEQGQRNRQKEVGSDATRYDVRTNMVNGLPPDMVSLPNNDT